MNVLVTGASGFLGLHVARRLLSERFAVRCTVRDLRRCPDELISSCELLEGDLAAPYVASRSVRGVDAVVHAAGRLGGWGPREAFVRDNVQATEHLLAAAAAAGVRHFVYVSSATSYGLRAGTVMTEETPTLRENDFYCETKLACEALVRSFAGRGGMKTTILRPAIIYGANDTRFLGTVVRETGRGTMIAIGPPGQGPPLVYAEDVARFIAVLLRSQHTAFEIYNLASPEQVSWETIVTSIARILGVRPKVRRIPFWLAYRLGAALECTWKAVGAQKPPRLTRFVAALVGVQYQIDASKAAAVTAFGSFTPFADGISRCAEWIRTQFPDNDRRRMP